MSICATRIGRGTVVTVQHLLLNCHIGNYSLIDQCRIGKGTKIGSFCDLYKCSVGENCRIGSFAYIEEDVIIGNNVKIKPYVFIPSGVILEDDVFIGPHVVFTNDKYPEARTEWKVEMSLKTLVKKGASVGANSVVLPGLSIGLNAMIGAGSVVTKDVPADSVIKGNPAI